uniref:Uncharacterized protein n=1 Tax=Romanomermis culicivorax TaxID=13658 RepID=A0A915L8C9_ROMCU
MLENDLTLINRGSNIPPALQGAKLESKKVVPHGTSWRSINGDREPSDDQLYFESLLPDGSR